MNYFVSIDRFFTKDITSNTLIPKTDELHELIKFIHTTIPNDRQFVLYVINADIRFTNSSINYGLMVFFANAKDDEFKIPPISQKGKNQYIAYLQPNTNAEFKSKRELTNFLYTINETVSSKQLQDIVVIDDRIQSIEFAEQHAYKAYIIKRPQRVQQQSVTQIESSGKDEVDQENKRAHYDVEWSFLQLFSDEILLMIAINLDQKSLFNLALTSKRFPSIVNQAVYEKLCRNDLFQFESQQKERYSPSEFNLFHFTNCLDKISKRFVTLCKAKNKEFEDCYGNMLAYYYIPGLPKMRVLYDLFINQQSILIRNHKYAAHITNNALAILGDKARGNLIFDSTLLHFVIPFWDIKATDLLLEKGFNMNEINSLGFTPIDVLQVSLVGWLGVYGKSSPIDAKNPALNLKLLLQQTRYMAHLIHKGINLCATNITKFKLTLCDEYASNLKQVINEVKLDEPIQRELIRLYAIILTHYKGILPSTISDNVNVNVVLSRSYVVSALHEPIQFSDQLKPLLSEAIEGELERIRAVRAQYELQMKSDLGGLLP